MTQHKIHSIDPLKGNSKKIQQLRAKGRLLRKDWLEAYRRFKGLEMAMLSGSAAADEEALKDQQTLKLALIISGEEFVNVAEQLGDGDRIGKIRKRIVLLKNSPEGHISNASD